MIKKITGLLIGTFVLLGSFTNAFNPDVVRGIVPIGDQSTFFDGNICTIDTSLIINCNRSNRTITSLDTYHNNRISSIFWSYDGIGVYYNNPTDPNKNCQGLIKSNFFICQGDYNNFYWPDLESTNCANGFTKIGGLSYQELLSYLKGSTPLYYYNTNKAGYYGASLGLIYEDFYFVTRVGGYECGINNGTLTSQNIGFTGNTYSDINFNNPYISNIPGIQKNESINATPTNRCPTIKQIMNNMGENYNTGLCYNNTTYFNGTNFEQVEKQDIFTIFNNDYENYTNRISTYRNTCKTPATQTTCQNAFSGEFKKYSIISNAINSNVEEKKLRNYCNMGLNYDPNATTCVASGYLNQEPTIEDMLNEIANGNYTIMKPGTGTVYDDLRENEEGYNVLDVRGNIDKLYGKITGIFQGRQGKNGIIPDIILRFGFAIILFTVIFKW